MKFPFFARSKKSVERIAAVSLALTGDRFCRDCKWAFEQGKDFSRFAKCRHVSLIMKDEAKEKEDRVEFLITGEQPKQKSVVWDDKYCLTMRDEKAPCGPKGKLWEQK